MFVDILSDTHFDSWFGYPQYGEKSPQMYPNKDHVIGMWRSLKPKSDYLILAGDIGHNISQNAHILKILKEEFYKEIILTLGNHDYYVMGSEYINTFSSGHKKALYAKKKYQEEGMLLLDGTVVDIEGVRIGGAMGWYNAAYIERHKDVLLAMGKASSFLSLEYFIQDLWSTSLNDKRATRFKSFDELFTTEYEKLNAVHKRCDVMVSHYNPSIEMHHQSKQWAKSPVTAFFCFDGEDLVKNTTATQWIYGHTHDSNTYTWHGKKIYTNALGYQNEFTMPKRIQTLELLKG